MNTRCAAARYGPSTGLEQAGPVRLSKVADVTALFWIIKILTTATGETASDWLLNRGEGQPGLGVPGALAIDLAMFVTAFALQFRVRRYVPAVYWFAVAAVAIMGTVAADLIHFVVGVPLWATTTLYAAVLAVDLVIWYRTEGTLSVHSITTRRREIYYWVAVFFTFALGTAVGDLTALAWNLGFLVSGFLFLGLILVPAVAHLRFRANAVLMFWMAYVLTRPLGASFADWLAVPPSEGGQGLGTAGVTLVAAAVIIGLVGYVSRTHNRRDRRHGVPRQPDRLAS